MSDAMKIKHSAFLLEERPNAKGINRYWIVGRTDRSYASRASAEQAARAMIESVKVKPIAAIKSGPALRYIAVFMIDGNAVMASSTLEDFPDAVVKALQIQDPSFIEIRDYGDHGDYAWQRSFPGPGVAGSYPYKVVMRGDGYAPRRPAV